MELIHRLRFKLGKKSVEYKNVNKKSAVFGDFSAIKEGELKICFVIHIVWRQRNWSRKNFFHVSLSIVWLASLSAFFNCSFLILISHVCLRFLISSGVGLYASFSFSFMSNMCCKYCIYILCF